jgi:hypothetical protein
MSTVIARRIASTPVRTASETWERIVSLLAADSTGDSVRSELTKAAGVACASISSEAPKEAPIVVWGGGARVRVYCVFGDDAITGEETNEDSLPVSATKDDWKMSIPCKPEDLTWSQRKLNAVSSRISARSTEDPVPDDSIDSAAAHHVLSINLSEFLNP